MWDRFTERAKHVISTAREEATRLGSEYVRTEHILLGLCREPDGIAARALENLGVDIESLAMEIEQQVQRGNAVPSSDEIAFTPRAKKVLELSVEEARRFNHSYIGTEHILGLVKEGGDRRESAPGSQDRSREDPGRSDPLARRSGKLARRRPPARRARPRRWTRSGAIHRSAQGGQADPVIGRESEIERVIQVPSRRTKNNPVLIGEAGGWARPPLLKVWRRPSSRATPDLLLGRRVLTLDLAGGGRHQVRGQFEERLKSVMKESGGPTTTSFCSSTNCTPSWAPARRKARWTPPTC